MYNLLKLKQLQMLKYTISNEGSTIAVGKNVKIWER